MRRRFSIILLSSLVLGFILVPRTAWAAGCGIQDLGACVDAAQYTFWFGLAALGWSLDRTLLLLAYQLATFRWWLVSVAFTSAYAVLTQLISPLIVPVATIAVIIGALALLLVPVFGRIEVVRIRHALVWVVIAPILLTLSGPLIVQTEELRSAVGTALFAGVRTIAPGAIFGTTGNDMAPVTSLYPSNPCGQSLARHDGDTGPQLDDLAAALLWADAEDIHCPERGGPDADVPDQFYVAAPDGPGYATQQDIGESPNAVQRTAAVAAIQRGAIRTFLGLLPSILAVLDALTQFIFALCLIVLWIGLPIGLLFVFFQQTADPVTGLFRRVIGVLQVSWSSSVVLGLLMACLLAAAELRNAAAYTGFAIGAIVLTSYILLVAVSTLKYCLMTLSNTVAVATGLNPSAAVATAGDLAAGAAGLGMAAVTGGAGAALASTVAAKQTGSGRYALGAALGQVAPLAQVGTIAAAMGESGELISGLVAGGRSQHGGVRVLANVAAADARRTDAQGMTMADHALERRLERTTAGRISDTWQQLRAEVPESFAGSSHDSWSNRRGQALHLDPTTRQVVWSPRVATDDLPAHTVVAPQEHMRLPRLLRLGYHVQANPDGTMSTWTPTVPPQAGSSDPQLADLDRRIALVEAGGLLADLDALRAERARRVAGAPATEASS